MDNEFSFMKDVPVIKKPVFENPFFKGYFIDTPRPTNSSEEVKHLVVSHILPKIMKWIGDDPDENDVISNLMDVISYRENGYTMAKMLDDTYSWDSDSELVDILNSLDFYRSCNILASQWISDNNIVPEYKVGDIVSVRSEFVNQRNKYSSFYYKGEITKVYPNGTYCIFIEELGHVRVGSGTHGAIVNWENVEKV